jgi:sugar lactone lactonase YvrE
VLARLRSRSRREARRETATWSSALKELDGTGMHVVLTPTRGRLERVRLPRTQVDAYVFRVPDLSQVVVDSELTQRPMSVPPQWENSRESTFAAA